MNASPFPAVAVAAPIQLGLAFLLAAFAGVPAHSVAAATKADLTRDVAAAVANKTLQAVSLGVIQADGTITAHLGGLAPDVPTVADDHTLYEIGSITKVFTSLLLADAVVRGELTLDTPIARLLPPEVVLPDHAGEHITLRMLATHTSGLPTIPVEIPADNYINPYATYGEADLWATLRRVKLDFVPGTKANYSNLAVGLLGTLIARNAGVAYAELLAARVTRPLGMTSTVIEPDPALRARFAPPFTGAGKPWTTWEFKALVGAGGIRSTLNDMLRFAAAMLRPADTPLQKAIELAWARQEVAATFAPGGQALGWMIAGDRQTRWHNGMTGGYHAVLFTHRELGVAVVLLSNRSTPVGTQLAEAVFRRAAGRPERPTPHQDRVEVALTAEQIDRYVGTFRLTPSFALVFERRNLALYLTPTGQPTDRLFAASDGNFFSRRVAAEVAFDLPADGSPAIALILKQGGRETRATRE